MDSLELVPLHTKTSSLWMLVPNMWYQKLKHAVLPVLNSRETNAAESPGFRKDASMNI